MPVRFLSDAELARLSSWPDEIADDDLITYFTLTGDDLGWLGANVRAENRLGAVVQLCALPWLGRIPDELSACPSAAVRRLAGQLLLAGDDVPGMLSAYGGWEGRTRRDHRALVLARLGWRASAAGDRKQLDAFLLARALEHDAPGVLLQLACDWLRNERIVRPSADTLSRRVATARDGARAETYHRLASLLAPPRPARLDGLLDVDDELGMTRLAWLRRGATAATPEVLKAELAKLEFLRAHGADRLDLSALPAGRRRMLAETGRRSTNQALQRADGDRRYPILLATLAETYVEVLDELVQLLDQALAGADSRARYELSQRVVERARVEIARGRLLDEVLDILADPLVSDADAGRLVRARVGMPRLQAARRPMAERDPRDHGHFDLLAARYKYLRTFTPAVIGHLPLTGNTANPDVDALLAAVEVLRELNAAARTTVPEQATTQEATAFVPARWRGYLDQAHGHGRGAAYRHYWELAVLYGVQAKLRSGDVWVPGSRRYTDPTTMLIPVETWVAQRPDHQRRHRHRGRSDAATATTGHRTARRGRRSGASAGRPGKRRLGPDRRGWRSDRVAAARRTCTGRGRRARSSRRRPAAADSPSPPGAAHRGRPRHPVHRGVHSCRRRPAAQPRPDPQPLRLGARLRLQPRLRRDGRRLGHLRRHPRVDLPVVPTPGNIARGERAAGERPPSAPARAPMGRRHAVLLGRATVPAARPQPHRPCAVALLPRRGHHHLHARLRPALDLRHQGHPDHLARSRRRARRDLRQPDRPADRRAHHRHRRPDPGHVRDLRSGRPAVLATHPRHRPTAALPPRRRALVALPLPESRAAAHPTHPNPADRRSLERPAPPRRLNEVRAHHRKPAHRQTARQQPTELTRRALQEYGRLVRTIYLCRYVADEELRRRVRRQLNKGESLHALRRDLFFAHQGHVRRRHLDDQVDQALCLTLVTNAAVLWTTTYLGDALDALRADGYPVTDEDAAHLTPAQHDHINFYGTYSFDLETELRREGHRPLRSPAA